MGLAYADASPGKVCEARAGGAPIDISAADSALSWIAQSTPLSVSKDLVALGGGRMLGTQPVSFLGAEIVLKTEAIYSTLQSAQAIDTEAFRGLVRASPMVRMGRCICPVVDTISKWSNGLHPKTSLATGRFMALGRRIDLAAVQAHWLPACRA